MLASEMSLMVSLSRETQKHRSTWCEHVGWLVGVTFSLLHIGIDKGWANPSNMGNGWVGPYNPVNLCSSSFRFAEHIGDHEKRFFPLWYGNNKPTNYIKLSSNSTPRPTKNGTIQCWLVAGSLEAWPFQPFIAWLGSADPKNCSWIKAWSTQPNTTVGMFFCVFRWMLFVGSENLAEPGGLPGTTHEKSHDKLKLNIDTESENGPLEGEITFGNHHFQVPCEFSWLQYFVTTCRWARCLTFCQISQATKKTEFENEKTDCQKTTGSNTVARRNPYKFMCKTVTSHYVVLFPWFLLHPFGHCRMFYPTKSTAAPHGPIEHQVPSDVRAFRHGHLCSTLLLGGFRKFCPTVLIGKRSLNGGKPFKSQ